MAGLLAEKKPFSVSGLGGSADTCLLHRLLEQGDSPWLVVAPDFKKAHRLYRDLLYFEGQPEERYEPLTPGGRRIFLLPAWEVRPQDEQSPHLRVSSQRIEVLGRMRSGAPMIVVAPVEALMQRVPPPDLFGGAEELILAGEELDLEELLRRLLRWGYSRVSRVEDPGDFGVKGGIVDVFCPLYGLPLRIEMIGETVETIRPFDPATQRSVARELGALREATLLPVREVLFHDDAGRRAATRLKELELAGKASVRLGRRLREDLALETFFAGVEFLQPAFHGPLPALTDLLGERWRVAVLEPPKAQERAEERWEELLEGYRLRREEGWPFSEPEELFLSAADVATWLRAPRCVHFRDLEVEEPERIALRARTEALKSFLIGGPAAAAEKAGGRRRADSADDTEVDAERGGEGAETSILSPLAEAVEKWRGLGRRITFVCHTLGQAERLEGLLSHLDIPARTMEREAGGGPRPGEVAITRGGLSEGFAWPAEGLVFITEEDLFGPKKRRAPSREVSGSKVAGMLSGLADLSPGDFVVHVHHGVGRYLGLERLAVSGLEGEFLHVEYAGGDKLYLPVDKIRLVSRYSGAEGHAPGLDKLGGPGWARTKKKVKDAVLKMAGELLRIYAAREACEGFSHSPPDVLYREMESTFPYEETPDQERAVEEVLADMRKSRPMDRLVCGDVGYGKTEVAVRAAFKSVEDGKQVAVLVPTTILAQQHLETFRERLGRYPLTVEALTRFRTSSEQKNILGRVTAGEVDIVIGTHRLLQRDVRFKNLGLVVVDEEQRFGVSHKEKLKKLRLTVDVLTLTATPIPRTLHMSFMGLRDMSIINTPPADRLSIRTVVTRFSDETIREATLKEIKRGGQVFFVHNKVKGIGAMERYLRELLPEARIATAHGQMDSGRLEEVMLDFLDRKFQILLCTTIIESGLDIPSVNTIIVNRADKFGLAQLYQLRGRVGRGSARAYAYLLLPRSERITDDARTRLKVIQDISELGGGFRIAAHDLELRGGGNLLGDAQSGHLAAVGFDLYTELMGEAVAELKGEAAPPEIDPEVNLGLAAFIPSSYAPDMGERLNLYKRLGAAPDEDALWALQDEIVDRYGAAPGEVKHLVGLMELRLALRRAGAVSLDFAGKSLTVAFHPELGREGTVKATRLAGEEPDRCRLTPDGRLAYRLDERGVRGVLHEAKRLLQRIA